MRRAPSEVTKRIDSPLAPRSYTCVGSIMAAMKTNRKDDGLASWSGAVLTDRNRGILDNITPVLQRLELGDNVKKNIIEGLRVRKDSGKIKSPYHALVRLFADQGLLVTGLILEVADSIDEASLSLGAAVMVAKKVYLSVAFVMVDHIY